MHSTPLPNTSTAPGSLEESRNDEECAVVSPGNGDVDRTPDDARLFAPSSVVDAASRLSRSAHFFSLRLMMEMAEEDDEVPLEEILEESKPMKGPLPPLVEATSKLSPSAHFFSQRLMAEIADSLYPFDDDDDDNSDAPTSENDEPNQEVNPPSRIVEILDSILEKRFSPADPQTGKKRLAGSLEDRRKRHKNTTGRPRRVTLDLASGGTTESSEHPPLPNSANSKS